MSHLSDEEVSGKANGFTTRRVSDGSWANGAVKTIEGSSVGPKMVQLFSKQAETNVNMSAGLESDQDWQYDDKRDKGNYPITHAVRVDDNNLTFRSEGVSVLPEAQLDYGGLGYLADGSTNASTTPFNDGNYNTDASTPYAVSDSGHNGSEAGWNLFNGNLGGTLFSVVFGTGPHTITLDLGVGTKLAFNKMILSTAGDGGNPSDYTIEATNDTNNWTVLETFSGKTYATGSSNTEAWSNSIAYRYYRIVMTGLNAVGSFSTYIRLTELQFIEAELASTVQVDSITAGGTELLGAIPLDLTLPTDPDGANNESTKDIVSAAYPTSNASNGTWTVNPSSEFGASFEGWRAFDNNAGSIWLSASLFSGGTPSSPVYLDLISNNKPVVINKYRVMGSSSAVFQVISEWKIFGRVTAGSWVELDHRTITAAVYPVPSEWYTFDNANSYDEYRYEALACSGSYGGLVSLEYVGVDLPTQADADVHIIKAINNGPTNVVASQHPDYPSRIRLTCPDATFDSAVVNVATQGVALTKLSDFTAYSNGEVTVKGPKQLEIHTVKFNEGNEQTDANTPYTITSAFTSAWQGFDGNETGTHPNGVSCPFVATLDLGAGNEQAFYRIELHGSLSSRGAGDYIVEGSKNGTEWVQLVNIVGNTDQIHISQFDTDKVDEFRYYRHTVTKVTDGSGLYPQQNVKYFGADITVSEDNLGIFPGAQIVDTLDNKYHITDISFDNKTITVAETLPPDAEWEVKRIANAETYTKVSARISSLNSSDIYIPDGSAVSVVGDTVFGGTGTSWDYSLCAIDKVFSLDKDGVLFAFTSNTASAYIGVQNLGVSSLRAVVDSWVNHASIAYKTPTTSAVEHIVYVEGGVVKLSKDGVLVSTWSAINGDFVIGISIFSPTGSFSLAQVSSLYEDGGFRVTTDYSPYSDTTQPYDMTDSLPTIVNSNRQDGVDNGAWDSSDTTVIQWGPTPSGVNSHNTSIDLGRPVAFSSMDIRTGSYTGRWFTTWDLQGSSDGLSWNTIASGGNEDQSSFANITGIQITSSTPYQFYRLGGSHSTYVTISHIRLYEKSGVVDQDHFHTLAPNGQDAILYKPSIGAQVTNFGFRLPDNSDWAVNMKGEEGYMAFATKFNLDLTPQNCVIYNKTTEEPEVIATSLSSERGGLGSDGAWMSRVESDIVLSVEDETDFTSPTGNITLGSYPIGISTDPTSFGSDEAPNATLTALGNGAGNAGNLVDGNDTTFYGVRDFHATFEDPELHHVKFNFGSGNEKDVAKFTVRWRASGETRIPKMVIYFSDDDVTYTQVGNNTSFVAATNVEHEYDAEFQSVGSHQFWRVTFQLVSGHGPYTYYEVLDVNIYEATAFAPTGQGTVDVAFPVQSQEVQIDPSEIIIYDENSLPHIINSGMFGIQVNVDGAGLDVLRDITSFITEPIFTATSLDLRVTIYGGNREFLISKISFPTSGMLWTYSRNAARAFAAALESSVANRNPATYFQYSHPDLLTQEQWSKYFFGTDKVAPFIAARSLNGGAPEFTNIWAQFSAALKDIKIGTGSVSVEPIVGSKAIQLTNVSGSTIEGAVDAYVLG